jgi:hypothetical protein
MDACQLADKFTTAELLERMKKIKAITWAITYHMQEERRARGEPGGYGEFS